MTSHEIVDEIEKKDVPGQEEQGIRIPLSLGSIREDFDKKGEPCQVYDVIWNPETIQQTKDDMLFR